MLSAKHYSRRPLTHFKSPPAGCCPVWKGILSTFPIFCVSTSFFIGNGRSVSFWDSRWNGESTLRYLFPALYSASPSKHLTIHSWLRRFSSSTNLGFGLVPSPSGQRELSLLQSLVHSLVLSHLPDSINWSGTSAGFTRLRVPIFSFVSKEWTTAPVISSGDCGSHSISKSFFG